MQVVIMAGGLGTRLYPLTNNIPKPMLPVGDQPLLQRIVVQLRDCGFNRIHISTYHCSEKIEQYFGDGQEFGVDIKYLVEEEPLGTAGALGLMGNPGQGILVLNGDVLTEVDFRKMIDFHHENSAVLTMAVHPYRVQVPYGVVESNGHHVLGMREKPQLSFSVNAGIYVLSPQAHARIEPGERMMMSQLIEALLCDNEKVIAFPFEEYWLDIGQHDQYQKAQSDISDLKTSKGISLSTMTFFGASLLQAFSALL
jgi:NDP-sugar pyrophosphorylase family protein